MIGLLFIKYSPLLWHLIEVIGYSWWGNANSYLLKLLKLSEHLVSWINSYFNTNIKLKLHHTECVHVSTWKDTWVFQNMCGRKQEVLTSSGGRLVIGFLLRQHKQVNPWQTSAMPCRAMKVAYTQK